MKILAFDTALGGCAVAVIDTGSGAAVAETRLMTRGQSEVLVPMIRNVMDRAGIAFAGLDCIVTTAGPGAFTGLRIGLSAARSFALALDIPVDGVLTTEAIAQKFCNENNSLNKDIVVVLETKRRDFYIHSFSSFGNALEEPAALSVELILAKYQDKPLTLCGDGLRRLQDELNGAWPSRWTAANGYEMTDPLVIAAIAARRRNAGHSLAADPVYLRGADVSQSARRPRVIAGAL